MRLYEVERFSPPQAFFTGVKEVLREGLDDPSELSHATSKLNSAVSRVRLKIEPDSENPKYLKTVRGQGYKLVL